MILFLVLCYDCFAEFTGNRFITAGSCRVLSSSRRRFKPSGKLKNKLRKLKVPTTSCDVSTHNKHPKGLKIFVIIHMLKNLFDNVDVSFFRGT